MMIHSPEEQNVGLDPGKTFKVYSYNLFFGELLNYVTVLKIYIMFIAITFLFIFSGIVVKTIFKNTLHHFFYFVAFIFFIIVAVMPTGEFMFYQLEKKFHTQSVLPSQVNGILILSGATNPQLTHEHNKIHLNGSVERLTESISLMQRYPNAKIIFYNLHGHNQTSVFFS